MSATMPIREYFDDLAVRLACRLWGRLERPPVAACLPALADTDPRSIVRHLAVAVGLPPETADRIGGVQSDRRYCAFVDFARPGAEPRLFLFDLATRSAEHFLVSHGKRSERQEDAGRATIFSNDPGSNCSSLGLYRCAEPYRGRHGLSLRLDGLETTNDNARRRAITLHGAAYVSRRQIARTGSVGCSDGCFAVDYRYSGHLVRALANGALLLAFNNG